MITSVNLNNANQYTVLFDEISDNLNAAADPEAEIAQGYKDLYTELSDKEKYAAFWTVDENGNDIIKITSLETYFSIIEQLVDIKPQYGILPLDEPYYEINANTRVITAPNNFSVQVQGDEIAETIYFKINRYFDTTDLSQQKIYIQWELPDSKKTKGYSQPWIVDIESEPGYVVFGWALTSIVTQVAGNVRFSVRFCNIDTDNTISYSLSTLTSILPIKTGLTLDFNDAEIIEDKAENRFKNGLLSGIVPASKPIISFQNFENDAYYFIVNNDDTSTEDSYQLQITGISPDAGSLNYSWYKIDSTTGKAELVEKTSDFIMGEYKVTQDINNNFIVNETYPLETFIKEYYCFLNDNGEPPTLIDEVDDVRNIFDTDIGELSIYVPIYTYDVTSPGYYYCAITNKVGLQSDHIKSNTAYFPMPIDPTPSHSEPVREGLLLPLGTQLTDSSIVQSNNQQIIDNSKYSYKWYEVVDSQEKEIEGANTQDYTVTKEGTYRCKVYSILNNANSKTVCSEWDVVQAPSLNITINNREITEAEELYFPIATSLEVKISNMTDYDQVSYSVKKVNRSDNTEISVVTEGNLLLSAGQNKFTFNSIPDKCKITCKGSVGINSIDETDEFIFYVDVGTVNT